jgi:5-formyltetrahydrofolate cyclo-ligase
LIPQSQTKDELRERVWKLLEEKGVARFPQPSRGRIPNFEGSRTASMRILETDMFLNAEVVKVNPDYPQLEVRRGTLEAGKMLIMPSPRLRSGFLLLDPTQIPVERYRSAATIRGSFRYGVELELENLPLVNLIVCGSVAVTEAGLRVGKGGGYSELEYAVLKEFDLVDEGIPIATSVHDLQIIEEAPREEYDFTVDLIATPKRLIKTTGPRLRPSGIIWEELPKRKLLEIPILRKIRRLKK